MAQRREVESWLDREREGGREGSLRDTRCEGTAELGTIDLEREKGGYNNGIGIGILEWL